MDEIHGNERRADKQDRPVFRRIRQGGGARAEQGKERIFEDQQKQLDELNRKLEAAQKANTMTDVSKSEPKVSAQEAVNDIFKNVIS